jgi:heme-degrading monooxygenase HmoA
MTDPMQEPLTFINVFEIPEDEIDTFVERWRERARFTTTADGFVSAELFRASDADTEFRVVNVTKWKSRAHFEAATHQPQFRAELDAYESADTTTWTPHRGFYRTVEKFD